MSVGLEVCLCSDSSVLVRFSRFLLFVGCGVMLILFSRWLIGDFMMIFSVVCLWMGVVFVVGLCDWGMFIFCGYFGKVCWRWYDMCCFDLL